MNGEPNPSAIFTPGAGLAGVPAGDPKRQAIDSIRGYAYQVAVSALAWLDLAEREQLFLEIAEDYATLADNALVAAQIKDTAGSGAVTLNSKSIRDTVGAFVDLVARNPGTSVGLRYLSTSPIGAESPALNDVAGESGLAYWRRAAAGANVTPLRTLLDSDAFSEPVREFVRARTDDELRRDLFRRIHWDCGQPGMGSVLHELEGRLIVIGRDRFSLPSQEVPPLVDILMHRVLQKCATKLAAERVLTRADLYRAIDGATLQAVPRTSVGVMTQLASALALGVVEGQAEKALTTEIGWLITGSDLPKARLVIPRKSLQAQIETALRAHGLMLLVGGSGLGKSLLARSIVLEQGGTNALVDLRDTDVAESRRRLDHLLRHIGDISPQCVVFEDLDHLDDPGVLLSFGRTVEALRRRDRVGIVTTHRRPSVRTLAQLGCDATDVLDVPYFSEAEATDVVTLAGGDSAKWGRVAYLAGAMGHPQLVHAFALGMAARAWPDAALQEIAQRGLSTDDIETAKHEARRRLTADLPVETRTLLYRLSLIIGRFDQDLAMSVAALPPGVSLAGERLDELVGPWIETSAKGQYRVSPLASNAGQQALAADEQRAVHALIANQLIGRKSINSSDASMLLAHALAGKATQSLAVLAHTVVTTRFRSRARLSEDFFMLHMLRTDRPIYPEAPWVSRFLRLAQYMLIVATEERTTIAACARTLLDEAAQDSDSRGGRLFEYLALSTVLNTQAIADHLPGWIDLLRRFRTLTEGDAALLRNRQNFESLKANKGGTIYGILFGIGATGISTIARLEEIVNALNELDAEERGLWLSELTRHGEAYGTFIDGPWLAEHNRNAIAPVEAAERYLRMAKLTHAWGNVDLAARCYCARALMFDEYADDEKAALQSLDEGNEALGEHISLSRGRARIHWRRGDHSAALKVQKTIVDVIARDSPIERAFALREAAISAASTDDWVQAEIWFAEAQAAAAATKNRDMHTMAIGLGADAAVAAIRSGKTARAIERFAEALTSLAQVDPSAALRSAYVHRVVRHSLLWTRDQFEPRAPAPGSEPAEMLPGACSNPEPPETIKDLPLGHIDLAWYMLAEIEIISGAHTHIGKALASKLAQGPIPMYEVIIQRARMARAIANLDSDSFAVHFRAWLDGMAFMLTNREHLRDTFDASSPSRGHIPHAGPDVLRGEPLQTAAVDANLAFGVVAVIEEKSDALSALEARLENHFDAEFPGSALFNFWKGKANTLSELDRTCASAIRVLRTEEHFPPEVAWRVGLRLFERVRQSHFQRTTLAILAKWMRARWRWILENQRPSLRRPQVTVPALETVLSNEANDAAFVAGLLLRAEDAVGDSLATEYRDQLRSLASSAPPPTSHTGS